MKQPNQYTLIRRILYWIKSTRLYQFIKRHVIFQAKLTALAIIVLCIYTYGQLDQREHIVNADTITIHDKTFDLKIDQLKNEVVDSISKLENESNVPIVFDDNKTGTLSKKDKASIGCMQFKISTVQKYEKDLYKVSLSDTEAVLLALDCTKAKALAKDVIFKVKGGIWNWSVATPEMGAKVEIIKQLEN